MHGEGPAVRFSPDSATISFWANLTGLKLFDSQQLEGAYLKAREFFLEKSPMLISDYGWQEDATNTTSIFHLSKPEQPHLQLPASFTSFLEPLEADKWSKMFRLFHATRNSTLFIDSPTPLADIFYLLQTLLPGMLLIYRIDEFDDFGEQEWTRALPPATWVDSHKEFLQTILEDTGRYGRLLAAAANPGLAEQVKMISTYRYEDDYDSGPMPDFTACDKECGYCGACDYCTTQRSDYRCYAPFCLVGTEFQSCFF